MRDSGAAVRPLGRTAQVVVATFGALVLGSCQGEEEPFSKGGVWVEFVEGECQAAGPEAEAIPAGSPPPTDDYPGRTAGDEVGQEVVCTIVRADDGFHVHGNLVEGDRSFSVEAVFTSEDSETFSGSGSVEFTSSDTGPLWSPPGACTFEASPPQGVEIVPDVTRRVWASFRCENIEGQGEAVGCTMDGVFEFHDCSS